MRATQAIEAGEIIVPEPYASKLDINKKDGPLVIQQSTLSVADEIKKLKELYDAGVLCHVYSFWVVR